MHFLKKFKSILFYIFVAAALGAAVWGYFYLRQTKKPSLNAVDVLPDKALVVVSAGNYHELINKLTNQNLIWNELINVNEFRSIHNQLQYFDSLKTENEQLKEFFDNRQIWLSVYAVAGQINSVIAFNLRDLAQENDFCEIIQTTLKSEKNSEGVFEIWNGTTKYNLKTASGVVVLTQDLNLLNQCFDASVLKQSKSAVYGTLAKNLDNDDLLNIYVNHSLVNKQSKKVNLSDFILSGHSVCNVEITPDAFTANGFNSCDSNSVLNCLSGQPAQTPDYFQIIPFSTQSYTAISIANYSLLKEKARISDQADLFWKQANDSAMFNVRKELEDNLGTKLIEARFRINTAIQNVLLIELKDTSKVNEALVFLSDSVTSVLSLKNFKLRDSISDVAKELFNGLTKTHAAYAFVFSNYLVITENKEANWFCFNSLINNSSLAQNELFMNYAKDNLLVNFNYQSYSSINKELSDVKETLPFLSDSGLIYFKKLNDWSVNITNYKNLLQFRANLKYQNSNQNKDVPGLWTCKADTVISNTPFTFKNHKSNENELVFQDAKNNLYLINATGNILWKKPINEKITSDIFTVDAFKNNKFQMLFSSKSAIHLIDRNGNYVPGFPLKLPAEATNALTLFDYGNTRDYRLMIACADKKIYNYNINATKNEKFTPIKTEHEVVGPIKYVKVGASDYLVVNDVEGKIYVYSRRGEGRIDLSNKLVTNTESFFIDASNSIQNTRLLYFDNKNSLLESISLVDKKDAVKLGSDFESATCFFELIDDDKKPDIVVIDKAKVLCYDFSGNELFRFESISDASYNGGQYYFDSDDAYFILTNSINEIHVVQASQKKIIKNIKGDGKPLVYDLFRDGKKYIIVSEGNFLKCVLLK